jgi:hypothetical protein
VRSSFSLLTSRRIRGVASDTGISGSVCGGSSRAGGSGEKEDMRVEDLTGFAAALPGMRGSDNAEECSEWSDILRESLPCIFRIFPTRLASSSDESEVEGDSKNETGLAPVSRGDCRTGLDLPNSFEDGIGETLRTWGKAEPPE